MLSAVAFVELTVAARPRFRASTFEVTLETVVARTTALPAASVTCAAAAVPPVWASGPMLARVLLSSFAVAFTPEPVAKPRPKTVAGVDTVFVAVAKTESPPAAMCAASPTKARVVPFTVESMMSAETATPATEAPSVSPFTVEVEVAERLTGLSPATIFAPFAM